MLATKKSIDNFLLDRFAYKSDDKVTVNALELADLLLELNRLQRLTTQLNNKLAIAQAFLDTPAEYDHIDLKA